MIRSLTIALVLAPLSIAHAQPPEEGVDPGDTAETPAQVAPAAPPTQPAPPTPAYPGYPPNWSRPAYTRRTAEPEPARTPTFTIDRAANPKVSVLLGGRTGFVRDSAYRLFQDGSEDDTQLDGGGIALAYDLLPVLGEGALSVGVGYFGEEQKNGREIAGGAWTSFDSDAVLAEARLRVPVLSWLQPHVRVAGGANRARVTVRSGTTELADRASGAVGSVGGGLTFRSPPIRWHIGGASPAFALSFALEGGYTFGSRLSFNLERTGDPEIVNGVTPIPTAFVPVGSLSRSFPYFGGQIGVHF